MLPDKLCLLRAMHWALGLLAVTVLEARGVAVLHAAETTAIAEQPSPEDVEFFETHIRPVLVEKCYGCHSADATVLKGKLRLDTAAALRAGGESGPAIVPHKPEASVLISALKYESNEMPPSGKLPEAVINDFVKWVAMGAPDPRTAAATENPNHKVVDPREHWAFKKPQKSAPPAVVHAAAARCDIDRFVIAKAEAAGLSPAAQALPRALLRRVYYDLTGLPPSAEQLDEFASDASDAHYEAVVDKLLASPRFGERWGRHWLDVARYADTKGYVFQEDRNYKGAYAYRDWVIASFNTDRPFDRFVVAQIAADQVADPSCGPASGFLTLGRRFLNVQADIIGDRLDVIGRGLMGLSIGCAKCHDHKFDPITAADYYSLYGVFASCEEKPRDDAPPEMIDAAKPFEPYVFLRGQPGNRGPDVPRRFMAFLTAGGQPEPFKQGSGRRELGEAIASRENPLSARVWVNRVWGHLFGKCIVDTPSDFGTRGSAPTHPELLDSLACEFMDDGWSTKRLIRRIVLSATYRQASDTRAECAAIDPENRLLWRANRRRLDLEELRDSLLVAAGRLDEKLGGPSVSITDAPFSTRRSVYGFVERQNLPAFFRTFDFANPNTHTPERPLTTSPQQSLFLMNSPFAIEQAADLANRSEAQATTAFKVASDGSGVAGVEPKASLQDATTSTAPISQSTAVSEVRRVTRLFRFAYGRDPSLVELTEALDFVGRGDSPDVIQANDQLAWQFGWGTYDEAAKSVQFQLMPRIIDGAWRGSEKLPDPAIGWALLNASGGHPGDAGHCVIRRWIAPAAGVVQIDGLLAHPAEQGDGVRGRVIASRAGVLGTWEVHHGETIAKVANVEVQKGDTIDFITDARSENGYDAFHWTTTVRLKPKNASGERVWDSVSGFHGRVNPKLTRWQELAQVLLMSNEFVFVD